MEYQKDKSDGGLATKGSERNEETADPQKIQCLSLIRASLAGGEQVRGRA